MIEHDLLRVARHDPAGRIVRRVDDQHTRAGREARDQLFGVERPTLVAEFERHRLDRCPEDLRNLDHVGPQRRDRDRAIAGSDDELRCEHERVDTGARDRDVIDRGWSMQAADIVGQRAAQRRDAEVVRVERGASRQRIAGGVANELRRDLVGFAEPERQDIGKVDAGVRDFTNARSAQ